jgi:L-aspartate oxidase
MDIQTDFLIIGSGVAGLADRPQTGDHCDCGGHRNQKSKSVDSNTTLAQGRHRLGLRISWTRSICTFKDTLASGRWPLPSATSSPGGGRKTARAHIRELMAMGVNFNTAGGATAPPANGSAPFDLGARAGTPQPDRPRPGHDRPGSGAGAPGAGARAHPNIALFENHMAIDLITHSIRMKRGQVTDHP